MNAPATRALVYVAVATLWSIGLSACGAPQPPRDPPPTVTPDDGSDPIETQEAAPAEVVAAEPGSDSAAADPPSPSTLAPIPFPVEALRAGIVDGEHYAFEIVSGGVPGSMEYTFAAPNDLGVTYTRTTVSGGGAPVTETREATWEELEEHAHFPRAVTTWTRESRTVAGQAMDGTLYASTQPDGSVMQAFFADSLPGPPAVLELWIGDQVVYSMHLRAHSEP